MAYQVKIGYGPGDWEVFQTYDSLQKAKEVIQDMPPIYVPRYRFPLPLRIKKVPDRYCAPNRAAERTAAIVARVVKVPPQLRKAQNEKP